MIQAEPLPEQENYLAVWYRQSSATAFGGKANIYRSPVEEVVVQVQLLPSETFEVYVQHKEPKLCGSAVVSSLLTLWSRFGGNTSESSIKHQV